MQHADDELLSALLDGEPAPGDAAHVDTCAACQARLASFRGVSQAVASVPGSPGHVREAALNQAIRGEQPLRVAARPRRMSSLSAAAVLLVVIAVGGWAINQIGKGSNGANTTFTAAPGATQKTATPTAGLGGTSSGVAQDAQTDSAKGAQAFGTPSGAYEAGDIGTVNDISVVAQHATADLNQNSEGQEANAVRDASPCPYENPDTAVWQATLTYNGEAAVAHLIRITESKQLMQILRRAGCAVIASQEFAPTRPR